MNTIADITKVAEQAINRSYSHYFTHLTTGPTKAEEAKFVVEVLSSIQLWLFFTEESLEELLTLVYSSQANINFTYTMTALFRQNFALDEQDYQRFVKHVATSFYTQENEKREMSLMADEYLNRLTKPEEITMLLESNRFLIMLVCTIMYLDTSIISSAMGAGDE